MTDPVVANDRLRVTDVRRLAAIDMYGARGTVRRRRIILAEFVLGVLAMVAFGSWLLGRASSAGGYPPGRTGGRGSWFHCGWLFRPSAGRPKPRLG
jgi:hypothetical protein